MASFISWGNQFYTIIRAQLEYQGEEDKVVTLIVELVDYCDLETEILWTIPEGE